MIDRYTLFIQSILSEFKHWRRKKTIIATIIGIPIMYPLVVSFLYQSAQVVERPVVIVDMENSSLSRAFSHYLDATQSVMVVQHSGNLDAGMAAVKQNDVDMMVYIPKDFSTRVKKHERSTIRLFANGANMLTFGGVYPAIHSVVSELNASLVRPFYYAKGYGTRQAEMKVAPVGLDLRYLYHPTGNYGEFLVPGILLIVVQQLILIGLAFSIGMKKEQRLIPAIQKYPFTYFEGVFTAQMLLYLIGIAFITFVIFPLFKWPMVNALSIVTLFISFMITMAPLAIIFANFAKDRYAAFELLMFFSVPIFMVSGYAMPYEMLSKPIQLIAGIIPATPALQALRILTNKTGTLHSVLPYLYWMGVQFVAYLSIAILVTRLSFKSQLQK
jgi:ABC-2 type transport system permease protein